MQENEQLLTVARMRADAEDLYGQKLGDIDTATKKIDGGFQRDDGASVKKVGIITSFGARSVLTVAGIRRGAHRDERGSWQSPKDSIEHP